MELSKSNAQAPIASKDLDYIQKLEKVTVMLNEKTEKMDAEILQLKQQLNNHEAMTKLLLNVLEQKIQVDIKNISDWTFAETKKQCEEIKQIKQVLIGMHHFLTATAELVCNNDTNSVLPSLPKIPTTVQQIRDVQNGSFVHGDFDYEKIAQKSNQPGLRATIIQDQQPSSSVENERISSINNENVNQQHNLSNDESNLSFHGSFDQSESEAEKSITNVEMNEVGEKSSKIDISNVSDETSVEQGWRQYGYAVDKNGVQAYKCKICDKIYKHKKSLKDHFNAEHLKNTFPCPHCKYIPKFREKLRHHIERVHLKIRIECPMCTYKSSDLRCLYNHLRKKHHVQDPKKVFKQHKKAKKNATNVSANAKL